MVVLFVPREIEPGETRVAAVPETIKKMVKGGNEVVVASGAGEGAYNTESEFQAAGATIASDAAKAWQEADIILKVQPPRHDDALGKHEYELPREGALIISFLAPGDQLDQIPRMLERKLSCFSMNLLPRITLAQKMDALSSQTNIAGYKAVLLGAAALGKYFPMLMTAAGTIKPAHVVIMGAGVAGLQAIATARRLGAVVEVSDIRPVVKEQVESLGAKFIEVGFEEGAEDAGGYAKGASEEFLKRQAEIVAQRVALADVVITTAQVPGKKAPVLITEEMVKAMRAGSVIVDLAAAQGGNCALTRCDKTVVEHGVKIIGTANIPATVPIHASETYSKNLLALVQHLVKDGELKLDLEDEITRGSLVTHAGEIVNEATAEAVKGKGA